MLVILIVAFIATRAFFQRAKEIGVHPGKAASIPFFVAGIMLAVTYLFAAGISSVFTYFEVAPGTRRWFGYSVDCLLILTYLLIIKRNWAILSAGR